MEEVQVATRVEVDVELHVGPVRDEFAVGNEHNWRQYRFQLDPGVHHLTAFSRDGRARLASTFRVKEKLNGVVDYWYSPGNPGGGRKLTFTHTPNQIAFA